ncbi:hypothetical protein Forpe1208_v016149 [Fusarium oxysporum f. sp. rapae]|uniref:Uncharacterized protein n=1 Tax=Fusarium oxysporum f. sp. rapae TaxID=485398 RepID=A0A8J5NE19_FUSOX|nr:hypothetical protein Forpe1208_v016149 [Fusarium oxysporum f. sp. rapae]
MPRKRRQQPGTPPDLPEIPQGAYKKAYYPHPDTVYYCLGDGFWRRGTISNETQSTSLHVVIDEDYGLSYSVSVEYIRKRADWD